MYASFIAECIVNVVADMDNSYLYQAQNTALVSGRQEGSGSLEVQFSKLQHHLETYKNANSWASSDTY